MSNFPLHRRATLERQYFIAVNLNDSQDRFTLEAPSERLAKIELLDKLGYLIDPQGTKMVLVNVDTKARFDLDSKTLDAALDEVLKAAHWGVHEPIVSTDIHL